ncbi:MAG: hypothetical protein LC772_06760 [Chloroflexi bacterium]|nr:hypothetical protein [Chloroflexota bacterium]
MQLDSAKGTGLAVYDQQARAVQTIPSGEEFRTLLQFSEQIADTEFVPVALRKRPAAVLACIAAGRELGIGPMQSLQKIHVIQGRPSLSAELMRSLVLSSGHQFCVTEYTDQRVTVVGRRRGEAREMTVSFGHEEARRAGLAGKDGGMYSKFPRSMYLARATSELGRALFPDVLAGFSYTPEEVSTFSGGDSDAGAAWTDPVSGEVHGAGQDAGPVVTCEKALVKSGTLSPQDQQLDAREEDADDDPVQEAHAK